MKGLAIFNSTPDLSYLWMDSEFQGHLIKKGVEVQLLDPAMDSTYIDEDTILSLAGQFFNPLVNSNKYMREVNNAYQTITCDNGFIFVMNQLPELSELFFIAICGDGEESELFLQKKISFFHRMLLFSYGPCAVDHLRPPYPEKRKKTWETLHDWLSTWTTLCQQEQMYLVESLERLHVNQELNRVSLNLLGEVLSRSNKDSTMHALLLVNNKLLGLYSSERSLELRPSDILLLIVLLKKKFKYVDEIIPKSIFRTPSALSSSPKLSKDDISLFNNGRRKSKQNDVTNKERDSSSSPNVEFHSAPSTPVKDDGFQEGFFTPRNSTISTADLINQVNKDEKDESVSMEENNFEIDCDLTMSDAEFETLSVSFDERNHPTTATASETVDNKERHEDIDNDGIDDAEGESEEEEEEEKEEEEVDEMLHHNIFLQTGDCAYAPYTAHCLLLSNATVLVLLSQHRQMYLAFYIQSLLRCLNLMLGIGKHKVLSYRLRLFEDCEKFMARIQSFFFRTGDSQTNRMVQYYKNFEKLWKLTQEAGLSEFINSDTISVDMNVRLENGLVGLMKGAKVLFTQLFVSDDVQGTMEESQIKMFRSLRELAVQKLDHYDLFLNVRGQQNVTMTAYHNDFPGLIHFIYVNRLTDQLIAPTVNVNMDSNNSMYILIKQRIWDFWQYSENMVSNGYTSFIVRDGDFCFSYFIWFEDTLGKPMISQKSLKDLNENKPTGILSGHYYKNLIHYLFPTETKGSINCYELVCMHVGLVSNQYIVSSCKKLYRILEGCGDANSPESIL